MNQTATHAMRRMRSPEEEVAAIRAFQEEIRPMQDVIVKVLAFLPPSRIILKNGMLDVEPVRWPEGLREMYDEHVRMVARRHGLEMVEGKG